MRRIPATSSTGRTPAGPPASKSTKAPEDTGADVNEIVAYNFRAARELRGWTQEETARRLQDVLGQRLPQASISAIERTYEGRPSAGVRRP
jgi:ribosome-binding protein aMBF1 (putative translation factor)